MVKRFRTSDIFIALAGIVLLVAPFLPSAMWYYAGRTNRDMFEVFNLNHLLLTFFLAAVSFAYLIGVAATRLFQRAFRRAIWPAVMLVLAVVLVLLKPSLLPPEVFQRGFSRWVQGHMTPATAAAASQWTERLPPTTQTALPALHLDEPAIPGEPLAADWPVEIRQLSPDRVIPLRGGLILQWGNFGTWGSSRRVFLTSPLAPKPDDGSGHYDYLPAAEGVWYAVQPQY